MNLSAIVVPRGRLPRKIPTEGHHPPRVRRMASTSAPPKRDVFEIGPRSKSRNSLDFKRQPQNRAYSGRSGFAWPFQKSGNNLETTSKVSLDRQSSNSGSSQTGGASQFRVVGRGGSGSKLRQVSLSNPIVVLETDTPSIRQQPLDQKTAFYRPSGRGGLGSLSTSPPTVRTLKPLKSPTAITDFLRGRKRSHLHLNQQYRPRKNSPPRRSQSVYYRSRQNEEGIAEDLDFLDELSRNSSFERPSTSFSQNILLHPDYDEDDHTNSNIEEVSRQQQSDDERRRERSLNKLTRTLGAHPLTIMEDRQVTKSPIFDNFSTPTGGRLQVNTGRRPMSHHHHHHQWDSLSLESDIMLLESDALSSPITFAPASSASVENLNAIHHHNHHHHHHHHHPSPKRTLPTSHTTSHSDDIDSSFTTTTTSSTREELEEEEEISDQSHSSPTPNPEQQQQQPTTTTTSTSPSRMPHLHVSTHSDAISVPYDVDVLSSDLDGPVAKPDWLVPLNEVVISIRRTAPSKPQSWTGEWNREMKDVIRDLRRL